MVYCDRIQYPYIGSIYMRVETITSEIDKFIFKLEPDIQAKTLRYIELLRDYGPKLGMPYSKSLSDRMFELRISGKINVRIIYCFHKGIIYLLHIFIKKQNKISRQDLDIAYKRFKMLA